MAGYSAGRLQIICLTFVTARINAQPYLYSKLLII